MIRCRKCKWNKTRGVRITNCPCQGLILTTGSDSANAKLHGKAGSGECLISDEYKKEHEVIDEET